MCPHCVQRSALTATLAPVLWTIRIPPNSLTWPSAKKSWGSVRVPNWPGAVGPPHFAHELLSFGSIASILLRSWSADDTPRYAGRVFRRGWNRVDGKLLDQRHLSGGQVDSTDGLPRYELREYLVEVPDERGGFVRLAIKEKSYRLKLPPVGGAVPVLVNSKRTEAAFDLDDPRIDAVGAMKAEEKAAEAADKERFESKLNSEDGGPQAVTAREAAALAEKAAMSASEGSDDPLRLMEAMEAAEEARDRAEREERGG